jgi:hypothetical protein
MGLSMSQILRDCRSWRRDRDDRGILGPSEIDMDALRQRGNAVLGYRFHETALRDQCIAQPTAPSLMLPISGKPEIGGLAPE